MEFPVLIAAALPIFIVLGAIAVAFSEKEMRSRVRTFIFRLAVTIILMSIGIPLCFWGLTMFEPYILLSQAKRIAGDRPYCIVVLDQDRNLPSYKAVQNRNELTFSSLVTHLNWGGSGIGNGMAATYYALLILKNPNEMRNWSKLYFNFRNDVEPTQESVYHTDFSKICTPIFDFAASIQ